MGKYSNFTREQFADSLKHYRTAAGMTRMELARKIDSVPSTITSYEKSERDPKCEVYTKLAKALGIDPIQFFINDRTLEILRNNDWKYSEDAKGIPGDKDSLIIRLTKMMGSLEADELKAMITIIESMTRGR